MSKADFALGAALATLVVTLVGYQTASVWADGIPTGEPLVYSGYLEQNGQPLDSTDQQMAIKLYSTETGGASLCGDTVQTIAIVKGRFRFALDVACVGIVHQNPELFVEIALGTQVLPRQPLAAVPYSVEAERAASAIAVGDNGVATAAIADGAVTTDKAADSAITTAKVADGAITTVKVANGAITTPQVADGAITAAKVAGGAIDGSKLASNLSVAGSFTAAGSVQGTPIFGVSIREIGLGTGCARATIGGVAATDCTCNPNEAAIGGGAYAGDGNIISETRGLYPIWRVKCVDRASGTPIDCPVVTVNCLRLSL